jgi:hypothetical protein
MLIISVVYFSYIFSALWPLFEKGNTFRSGPQVKQGLHLDYTNHKFGQQNVSTDPNAKFHLNSISTRSYKYVRSTDPVIRTHKTSIE